MNIKALIKKYEAVEYVVGVVSGKTILKTVLRDLKQLDEPQKVKVPQFVADWIEEAKRTTYNIRGAIEMAQDVRVKDWLELKNVNIFAEAWVNGYEVEEEKRYTVKIKGNIKENMLVYGELLERYFFTKSLSLDNAIYSHTRKELEEADFGWVFDCPGIEVEEVE